ncbi:MAG: hypothetical protein ACM3VT_05315 [Solirubrobacterales bacterium]
MMMKLERVLVVLAALAFLAGPAFADAILGHNDVILVVDSDGIVSSSSYPPAEGPANVLDGDPNTKYLNFGEVNSGFIVTPAVGVSLLDSFQITTANDAVERDPVVWMIYGTNDVIVDEDNSDGMGESRTLICGATSSDAEPRPTE